MEVSAELIGRFNEKWVKDENSECHIWIGARLPKGYGIIKRPRERKQVYAHRLSYLIHKGEIPKRTQVLHSCDNPRCVNPEHLSLGTQADNMQDMKAKSRHLFGSRNAVAKLTEHEVIEIRALYESGVRQKKIAEVYGVQQAQVSRIVRRERWQHLPPRSS